MSLYLEREMQLQDLIQELDQATATNRSTEEVVKAVEQALCQAIGSGFQLPGSCCQTMPENYARHLVHVGPGQRYSVVAMVWGLGQGTPLHDHAHTWCVECVLEGKIKVTNYRHQGKTAAGNYIFEQAREIIAGQGEAGHLIPPLEYHTIHNAQSDSHSITLHVYGGLYTECSIFVPQQDGSFQEQTKQMTFDSSLYPGPQNF